MARYVAIWFRHLVTDWYAIKQPVFRDRAFIIAAKDHGRLIVTAASPNAQKQGISPGMTVADAKALHAALWVVDEKPGRKERLLTGLGEWAIRYTPTVAVDAPDGLILDISGCSHLWGGEYPYLKEIVTRLRAIGYDVRAGLADTIGTAWAIARFGNASSPIIDGGGQLDALIPLPPAALRLAFPTVERLHKLGLTHIGSFIQLPANVLRRRFGTDLLLRMRQALGEIEESITPVVLPVQYQERLPCLDVIRTATGIEMAIHYLAERVCLRLKEDGKGVRTAVLKCFRIDGIVQDVKIGTSIATHTISHICRLFGMMINTIEPALGIELFIMEAVEVGPVGICQEKLWAGLSGVQRSGITEFIDRVILKMGAESVHRYLPQEHYWPERSIKETQSLQEDSDAPWLTGRPRPVHILKAPEPVQVTAPIPDYPPMLFRYKGQLHEIKKADGPERIEREWWLEDGQHRDYYIVEDQDGKRYWLFRSGHYQEDQTHQWFIHGFFA